MKHAMKWGTGIAAMLLSSGASAYQFEGTGTYTDFDDLDDSSLGVIGQYFFNNVDDSGVPRAEAAFLGRASSVGLAYFTFDEADVDSIAIGGEIYFQNFYAAAALGQTSFGSIDRDDISLEFGFLPMDGLRLTVGYDDEDSDLDILDLTTISLNGKYVVPLAGDKAFSVGASIAQSDDADDTITYMASGDFFINQNLSFGAGFEDTDQSGSSEAIALRARMFVIPNLSVQLQYNMQDDNDSIELGVTGRF